jgi:hypothetical protein
MCQASRSAGPGRRVHKAEEPPARESSEASAGIGGVTDIRSGHLRGRSVPGQMRISSSAPALIWTL